MANRQFRNKLAHFRMNPVRPPVAKPVAPRGVIMGDLLITIVSLKNLKTNQGSGDVYVEVKSYEHGKDEDQFATFEFDDSPIKGTESYKRPTKMLNKTMPEPFDRNVYFNEEQNMGMFVKGETHEISFVVKQKTKSGDAAIGEVSIKSDDYLDPFRPAREVYLLFYDPPRFQSSLYLNVLFVPSNHTLDKMRITKPVPEDFDSAYHEWILSKNVYVDDYKFIVPIGTYSNLVDPEQIRVDEEDYEEHKEQKKYGVTPEKRLRNAIDSVPSLRDYNHQLREKNSLRPEYEDILYHFRQMQMYLNNEAKAKANQMRQEYCWNDFLMKVTENIHDNSVDPSGDVDEFGENADPKTRGHMFSVAGRSTWGKESWQNVDIQTLCRLGISPNLRNRVWYDLLEVSRIEEMTEPNLVELPEYSRGLNTYENLKLIAVKYTNIAFAQIDEDMNTLNISNTPTVDDRGKIKNILKCFVLWQKICETSLCYSINFWFIIQRLLSFYSEERAFWVFVGIMDKMKNRIGIERSLMLDRKGMFRLCSACLSSHCKQMMPEIFSKFTEIGVSIDFFLYDQMSSLFSNCFPSDTLLRLWDLIFLDFSSPANGGVSKGLGYIISTSLYLLKVNEAQILISNTPEELSIALHNSCSTKFDTEEIISDIYDLNDRNFVAGNWFSRRLASVSKTFGDAASYLDNARISFEEDLDLVFEKTIRENRAVWDLLHPAGEEEPLDYLDWFGEESSILPKFKRKFSQIPSSEFSTAARGDSKNGNLKFRNVFIFVYSLFDNQTDINAKIELSMEYSGSEVGNFQIERYDKMTALDQSFQLEYNRNVNYVNIVVYEAGKKYGSAQIDLNDFKSDEVNKLWIDVVNDQDNEQDLEFEIGVLCEGQRAARNDENIINHSLRRKAPERVDILNEKNINEFVKKTRDPLLKQIDFERSILEEYFSDDQIRLILNNKYNFVVTKENLEMGRIDLDDLDEFCSQVLFSRWSKELEDVYYEFTTPTKDALDNKSAEVTNILDKAAVILLCKTMARRNHQLYGLPNQDVDYAFSIKNFMTTLILLSSITLGQKLDLVYEIFDWDDGEGDGLDHKSLKLL